MNICQMRSQNNKYTNIINSRPLRAGGLQPHKGHFFGKNMGVFTALPPIVLYQGHWHKNLNNKNCSPFFWWCSDSCQLELISNFQAIQVGVRNQFPQDFTVDFWQMPAPLCQYILKENGEKHYVCNKCDQTFTQCSNLKTNMLIHREEKHHTCNQCPQSIIQSGDLKRHMLKHCGEKPHACK